MKDTLLNEFAILPNVWAANENNVFLIAENTLLIPGRDELNSDRLDVSVLNIDMISSIMNLKISCAN